jgi:hypothetical protein
MVELWVLYIALQGKPEEMLNTFPTSRQCVEAGREHVSKRAGQNFRCQGHVEVSDKRPEDARSRSSTN